MNTQKTLQELTIKDGFMFYALMNDPEICRELLEVVLDKKIEEVIVHQEDSLMYHPKFHGIRLDVIAIEHGTRRKFNVEMQTETYVIFICDFDPFGQNLYRYRYQMFCSETDAPLGDGSYTVFLNSKGKVKDGQISENLIAFLEYVANPEHENRIEDSFVSKIDRRIHSIRLDREWEAQYMLLRETLREEREEARLQGLAEGRAEGRAEGLAEGMAEGRSEGLSEGRAEGTVLHLIEQILKKNGKKKSLEQVKEELEDDSDLVEAIYRVINEPNAPKDASVIYKRINQ